MPATRSRTSTEQPESAQEDVKNSETDQQNEEESVEKSSAEREDENNENSTSTTFEDKEVEESEDNDNDNDSNEVNDVKDANGDQSEEKVENGSVKRKSEVGEGDVGAVGPDSTDVITKKAKLDAKEESTNEVEVEGVNNP